MSVDVVMTAVDGTTGVVRFRRRAQAIRVTFQGQELGRMWVSSLTPLLSRYRDYEWQTQTWKETTVAVGQGRVQISLGRDVVGHLLTDKERLALATLAARPIMSKRGGSRSILTGGISS